MLTINGRANIEPQSGCDLLIAATSTVQLVANITADQSDKPLLDKMVDVFGFVVLKKLRGCGSLLADLLQPLQDGDQLARRQHTSVLERLSVGPAGRQFMFEQPA